MRSFALVVLMTSSLMGVPAMAGPIVDKATEAERLLQAQDAAGALSAINQAVDEVWRAMPLTVTKAALVDSAVGYGIYAEKDGKAYKSGEKILVYAEVVGYQIGSNQLGGKEIAIDVDLGLKDATGETVFSQDGMMKLRQPVRYFNKEFFLKLDLNFTGAPAGDYTAVITLNDRSSGKSASFDMPFTIAQ